MEQQMREIIEAIERVIEPKMWRFDRNCNHLAWLGESPDGNEVETEDPREILKSALSAASSALEHSGWRKWPEEKPKEYKEYNIVESWKDQNIPPYVTTREYDGEWVDFEGYGEILFWQPLPSLPKSEA